MAGKKRNTKPSASPDALMLTLSRRGPYRVLRGDLGFVGMPGQIFTPATGKNRPAIAFGHRWLAGSRQYRDLLYHLASWGIVAVAPDAQRGVLASDTALAADLRAALDVVTRVRLGTGAVHVAPDRIGLAGHGFGAAAAVLAASDRTLLGQRSPEVKALAALYPSPTTPALLPAADTVDARGLIVGGTLIDTVDANALPLTLAYGGDVVLRTLPGTTNKDLVERFTPGRLVGVNGANRKAHTAVRALVTGFFLHTLTDDPEYRDFVDPEVTLGRFTTVDVEQPPTDGLDPISRLLGAKPGKRRARIR